MSDELSDIVELIRRTGEPMGVNAISKALNVPLSTMQKRLEKSGLVKTAQRKWDLPENVQNAAFNSTSADISSVLKTQAASVNNVLEMLQSGMSTLTTMINAASFTPSVASSVPNNTKKIDKRVEKLIDQVEGVRLVVKEHKDKIDPEYVELVLNVDWIALMLYKGLDRFNEVYQDISSVILKEKDKPEDSTLDLFEMYQKE